MILIPTLSKPLPFPLNFLLTSKTNSMGLNYKSLDAATRAKMIDEFNSDIGNRQVYYSKRFTPEGEAFYLKEMIGHLTTGSDDSLADSLKRNNCFKTHEERRTAKGISIVKVPENAPQTYSEGEFNRFYIRAVCLRAIDEVKQIRVYRGRHSENPRAESEALIGKLIDPAQLLADLRNNIGVDTALGLPQGPNSGLTIEIIY